MYSSFFFSVFWNPTKTEAKPKVEKAKPKKEKKEPEVTEYTEKTEKFRILNSQRLQFQ